MARTVLFSNQKIASFINDNFEPVWQSVRKVPTVTIDFGNGKLVKRTLNGNIASYVCTANGNILDILPGLYEPNSYQDRLEQLVLLHKYITAQPEADRQKKIVRYHQMQYQRLSAQKSPARFEMSSGWDEARSIKLSTNNRHEKENDWSRPLDEKAGYTVKALPKSDLAQWQQLTDDVRFNETVMRSKIHERLAQISDSGVPSQTKWLYREVLHADLDDPYLGLKPVLEGVYPFDRQASNGSRVN